MLPVDPELLSADPDLIVTTSSQPEEVSNLKKCWHSSTGNKFCHLFENVFISPVGYFCQIRKSGLTVCLLVFVCFLKSHLLCCGGHRVCWASMFPRLWCVFHPLAALKNYFRFLQFWWWCFSLHLSCCFFAELLGSVNRDFSSNLETFAIIFSDIFFC